MQKIKSGIIEVRRSCPVEALGIDWDPSVANARVRRERNIGVFASDRSTEWFAGASWKSPRPMIIIGAFLADTVLIIFAHIALGSH